MGRFMAISPGARCAGYHSPGSGCRQRFFRYARQHVIDLIVLATHGRSGLAHVLIGSVAESVVRTTPCPVLTVRPEGHQFVMP
jgi:hypothetical protein